MTSFGHWASFECHAETMRDTSESKDTPAIRRRGSLLIEILNIINVEWYTPAIRRRGSLIEILNIINVEWLRIKFSLTDTPSNHR